MVAPQRRWNSLGLSPVISRNRLLNEPRLLNPTAWQTSVTVRFVARSRSCARSTRRSDEVRRRGHAVRRGEQPVEVPARQAGSGRDGLEVQGVGVARVDEVARTSQVDEDVPGNLHGPQTGVVRRLSSRTWRTMGSKKLNGSESYSGSNEHWS